MEQVARLTQAEFRAGPIVESPGSGLALQASINAGWVGVGLPSSPEILLEPILPGESSTAFHRRRPDS